ncbi:MAG: hypothetical protein ABI488_10530 [Polyangiaceae bacterium]
MVLTRTLSARSLLIYLSAGPGSGCFSAFGLPGLLTFVAAGGSGVVGSGVVGSGVVGAGVTATGAGVGVRRGGTRTGCSGRTAVTPVGRRNVGGRAAEVGGVGGVGAAVGAGVRATGAGRKPGDAGARTGRGAGCTGAAATGTNTGCAGAYVRGVWVPGPLLIVMVHAHSEQSASNATDVQESKATCAIRLATAKYTRLTRIPSSSFHA